MAILWAPCARAVFDDGSKITVTWAGSERDELGVSQRYIVRVRTVDNRNIDRDTLRSTVGAVIDPVDALRCACALYRADAQKGRADIGGSEIAEWAYLHVDAISKLRDDLAS